MRKRDSVCCYVYSGINVAIFAWVEIVIVDAKRKQKRFSAMLVLKNGRCEVLRPLHNQHNLRLSWSHERYRR